MSQRIEVKPNTGKVGPVHLVLSSSAGGGEGSAAKIQLRGRVEPNANFPLPLVVWDLGDLKP